MAFSSLTDMVDSATSAPRHWWVRIKLVILV
jgi:hypothetical protein